MQCPYCQNNSTKVIDSRQTDEGCAVRRRRQCEHCEQRFTTYERIERRVAVSYSQRRGELVGREIDAGLVGLPSLEGQHLPDSRRALLVKAEAYRRQLEQGDRSPEPNVVPGAEA